MRRGLGETSAIFYPLYLYAFTLAFYAWIFSTLIHVEALNDSTTRHIFTAVEKLRLFLRLSFITVTFVVEINKNVEGSYILMNHSKLLKYLGHGKKSVKNAESFGKVFHICRPTL